MKSKILKTIMVCCAFLVCNTIHAQIAFDNYALTGLTIIDANHRTPLSNQTVLITKNVISDIFGNGNQPVPDSFNIIRMEGKYLLPGLIGAHVHMATDPSFADNRAHTLDILQRMLFSGITSVRDMAGNARTLASLSRDALNDDIISPDIYYSALMAGPVFFNDPRAETAAKGGVAGKMPYLFAVTDSTNMVIAVAEAKGSGATGIKLFADLSAQLVAKIIDEANKQGMIVWGHAWLQNAKPSDLVKAGVNPISHSALLIHDKIDTIPLLWKNQRHDDKFWKSSIPDFSTLFQLMKAHNTILDATMLTYKQWGEQDTSMQYDYEITKRITAQAYKAGVMIDAGTDDNEEALVQKEMELLVNDAGLSNFDALVAATLNGAYALHINNTRGTVSVGKIANLVVLNKNPLQKIENIESVFLVIKNGIIFKK